MKDALRHKIREIRGYKACMCCERPGDGKKNVRVGRKHLKTDLRKQLAEEDFDIVEACPECGTWGCR